MDMWYLIIFNTIINIWVVYKFILKKYFYFSVYRQIFTDKILSVTLMKNNAWHNNGNRMSAKGVFTIPIRKCG